MHDIGIGFGINKFGVVKAGSNSIWKCVACDFFDHLYDTVTDTLFANINIQMDPQISSLANELSNSIETILNPSSSQNDRQISHKVRNLERS